MEKIYMEQNNKRSSKISKSVILSFVLAFVAIISIATYGITNVTYAADDTTALTAPETLKIDSAAASVTTATQPKVNIPLHYATVNGVSNVLVYCIEQGKEANTDNYATNTDTLEVTDDGLLYILTLMASGNDSKYVLNNNAVTSDYLKGWLTQTAVWIYLKQTDQDKTSTLTDEQISVIKAETELLAKDASSNTVAVPETTKAYYQAVTVNGVTVENILANAIAIHNGTKTWERSGLNVTLKSKDISLTSEKDFYQSDLITAVIRSASEDPYTKVVSYKLSLGNAPAGTILVDKEGKVIDVKELDALTTNREFFVRVPAKEVTEKTKTVTLNADLTVQTPMAYVYASKEHEATAQKIVYITPVTTKFADGLDIPFDITVPVPDTAMSVSQAIYFIGLVILLAGVGVIYANVKPKEEQE